jgi:protocatechuate 3,4-dioxygenase beta subunit
MMQALVVLLVSLSLSQGTPAATTGRIAGRVTVKGANTPIAGARILLFPAGPQRGPIGMPPQITTDQEGRFVFDQLAPGVYRLDVQKTGFASLATPGSRPSTIQVAAGQTVDGVQVQLERGGVIAGKVLDPSGEPIADARIMALRRVDLPGGAAAPRFMPVPMQGPQQTNDLGEFRVSGLAPGEYYVAARPGGALAFGGPAATSGSAGTARTALTTTFYPGTTDQAGAQSVTVASGAEVGNIVFTIQSAPAFRVLGVVVDEDGTPVARAMVMLMGDPRNGMFMGPAGSTQSQDDGRFVIGDVPSGSYRVTATVPFTVGTAGASGGLTGGTFTTFSSTTSSVGTPPPEVVVADADIGGLRVVVRRPPR